MANRFGVSISRNLNFKAKCLKWWLSFKGSAQDQLLATAVPAFIVWSVWLARNDIRHGNKTLANVSVCPLILNWLTEINVLIKPKSSVSFSGVLTLQNLHLAVKQIMIKMPILVQWSPPALGNWKMNIDGASRSGVAAGCGGIVRKNFSELLFAFSEFLGEGSNNMAEMSGLFVGLIMCYQLGVTKILIETDSLLLLHWFLKVSSPPWRLWRLWSQISELLLWIEVEMVHVYREGNSLADVLAKEGADGVSQQYWHISDLSKAAVGVWCVDALEIPSWRQPK